MHQYFKSQGLSIILGSSLLLTASGCVVEDPLEDEREKYEYESLHNNPLSGSYEYVKCTSESSLPLANSYCGVKTGPDLTDDPMSYQWNTNCNGKSCSTVSVFAHYRLNEDLGPGQTLRIEAFDNPQFQSSPVASLAISGFNASRPTSTDREELYLAPGEYYFRAFITYEGDSPLPYTMEGMELVGDRPVGFLGAKSGAERVLIKANEPAEVINIYIDQLYEKPQTAEDSLAKLRLLIEVDPLVTVEKFRNLHIVLFDEADLEALPVYDFSVSTNELLIKDQENHTDFVSPSLTPGSYYVYVYIDSNGNDLIDAGELGSFVLSESEAQAVKVEKNRTRSARVQLLAPVAPQ